MFKKTLNRLLDNRLLCTFCWVVYLALLGPALISAASTELVVIGLIVLGLLIWWTYSRFFKGAFK
jgi:hypothetical protein